MSLTKERIAEIREYGNEFSDSGVINQGDVIIDLLYVLDAYEALQADFDEVLKHRDDDIKCAVEFVEAERDRLKLENESLNMQLENRIRIERDQKDYIACVKERTVWAQKCAILARESSRYKAALEEIANDGRRGGMGGGLRRGGDELRDIARVALKGGE